MSDHWKSLADLLGAPSLTPSKKPSEPIVEKAKPEIAKEQPRQIEPEELEVAEPEVDEPMAAVVEPAKPKKRSSWEALANLFNIGTAPQPEREEPAPEPTPAPVAAKPPRPATKPTPPPAKPARPTAEPTSKQSELSLFKPTPSEQNPALVDMFGEASATPHESWGKPRRVVDDLSWDDENTVAKKAENKADAPVKPVRSLDETAEIDELDSEDGEPVRRSRRRRRRGGRGRGEDQPGVEDARPEETTAEFRDSSWGKVVSDDAVDVDDDIPVVAEEDDENSPLAERRPRRRRRRRGRGRGPGAGDEAVAGEDDVESVNRDLLNTDDDDEPAEELFEGSSRPDASAEAATDPRRRRRKRNRGGKRLDDPNLDNEVVADDDVDAVDASDIERDDEEEGGNRHRNIPTWEDSLSVLIEANIENHRRNDNRGGGGPRGGGPRGGGRNRGGGGRR